MDLNKLLAKITALGVCALISSMSYAQNELDVRTASSQEVLKHIYQLKASFTSPTKSQTKFEKSNQDARVEVFYMVNHDGNNFVTTDSTNLYWSGERNNKSLVPSWLEQSFYLPLDFQKELAFSPTYNYVLYNVDSLNVYKLNYGTMTFDEVEKVESSFDAEGNIKEQVAITNQAGNWHNTNKLKPTYDNNKNLVSIYSQNWDINLDVWKDYLYNGYTYNSNHEVIGTVSAIDMGSGFDSLNRSTYTFDSQGALQERLIERWTNNGWGNLTKTTPTYNNNADLEEVLIERWDGSQWGDDFQYDISYDGNGNMSGIIMKAWDFNTNAWENIWRYRFIYNSSNEKVSHTVQEFDNANNRWQYKYQEDYSYDGNNLIEVLISGWVDSINNFDDSVRYTYTFNNDNLCTQVDREEWDGSQWEYRVNPPSPHRGYFSYESYQTSGLRTMLEENDFNLYPNPATEELNIKMNNKNLNQVQIIDLSGKVVYKTNGTMSASKVTLPVGSLPNGIYFLEVDSNGQKGIKKFIVQH